MNCRNCGSDVADQLKFCPKCGTPVPASAYTPPAYQPAPAWQLNAPIAPVKRKSNVGKILLIVGIIFVVLVGAIGVAVYFGARSYVNKTKSSAPYALAESTLRSSERVKEKMGEIKSIGVPIGTYGEEADGTGYAAYVMSVEGEKANGQYVVVLDRRNSEWRMQTAKVQLSTGEEINVVNELEDNILIDPTKVVTNDNANQSENTNEGNSNNANQKSRVVSGGVLNGKATSLPKPAYPAIAKSARASGTVVVQVMVDEEGKVISASAVSGHPLLRASAVAAARQARFTPTLLGGTRVKVSGVINYNFVAEP